MPIYNQPREKCIFPDTDLPVKMTAKAHTPTYKPVLYSVVDMDSWRPNGQIIIIVTRADPSGLVGAESIRPALETLQTVGKWLLEISASRYVKLSQPIGIGKISKRQKLIAMRLSAQHSLCY